MLGFEVENVGKSPAYGVQIDYFVHQNGFNLQNSINSTVVNPLQKVEDTPIILMGNQEGMSKNVTLSAEYFQQTAEGYRPILITFVINYSGSNRKTKLWTAKTFILQDQIVLNTSGLGTVIIERDITFSETRNEMNEVVRRTVLAEQDGRRDYK